MEIPCVLWKSVVKYMHKHSSTPIDIKLFVYKIDN